MKTAKPMIWVMVLLAAAACTSPTAVPPTAVPPTETLAAATAPVSTQAPATIQATASATTGAGVTLEPSATAGVTSTPEAAASPTETTASPTQDLSTPGAVSTVGAGEVVKLSGDTFTTSETLRFSADTTLDVSWNYTGTAPFALWLVNVSEIVTDPQYDRILIVDITGPHTGTVKQGIIAGDWTVQVEQAEGPWTVDVKPES